MAAGFQIVAIVGPTASGKSALAMDIARKIGAEILSVDSMQVYRGMDIGTAKPSNDERRAVPHHLIDLVAPDETFTVARFVQLADKIVAGAKDRTVPLIAVGGTPLYYKALFQGLFDGPGADNALRDRLRAQLPDELHRRLSEIDPPAAARIHRNDHRRLIRALEVFELTGSPISSFQTDWESPGARHEARWFGLMWEKDALNHRINTRTKEMMSAGWLEETRSLVARYPTLSKTAAEATGYHELIAHLNGQLTREESFEQIKIATRQLARRQMKWLRRFPGVTWLKGNQPPDAQLAQVLASLGV